MRIQPDRRLRLFEVIKSFRRIDSFPLVPLADIEVLEVFQIEHGIAAEDLEPDLAAGQARIGEFSRDPHLRQDVPLEHDLRHDRQRWAGDVAEGRRLSKHLDGIPTGQPTEKVGVVRRHSHEQTAAPRIGHPRSLVHQLPRQRQRKRGYRAEHLQRPEYSVVNQLLRLLRDLSESLGLHDGEVDSSGGTRGDHLIAFRDRGSHRLLGQHVLSRRRRLSCQIETVQIGSRQHHGMDIVPREQQIDRGLRGHAVVRRQLHRTATAGDGDQPAASRMPRHDFAVGQPHEAATNHPDTDRLHTDLREIDGLQKTFKRFDCWLLRGTITIRAAGMEHRLESRKLTGVERFEG